jgi:endoglucanase
MDIKEILRELTGLSGVSGDEFSVCEGAERLLREYGETTCDRSTGCVYCKAFGHDDTKPTLLLDAHIDEIGMIVTHITDDGFLKVSQCGGLDNRVLLAQQVTVYGRERLTGFVTSTPPHLEKDSSAVPEIDDIYIDIGFSGEQAKKLVSLGDRVLIENTLADLQNGRVTSKALDDRSGMAAVILALDMLKGKKTDCNIVVLFSSQEEVGERGATIGAYNISPDYAIAVDVSFGKTHGESADKCGELGKGGMIGIAPSLSRKMSDRLIQVAQENGIPYQIEVMGGRTGTNADAIGLTRGGVAAATVSIPEKHMHTPVEVVDMADIENTARLIARFAEEVKGI